MTLTKAARSIPIGEAIKAAANIKKSKPLRKGYQRTVGYYGRFSGPGAEMKFFDTALSFNVDATAEVPATGQLCIIPQDDTQSGRDGNKAFVKSIYIKGTMAYTPGASDNSSTGTVVWMYLMQDTQCNGVAATVGDANSGIFTTSNMATAQITLANKDRFKVLKKWIVPLNVAAGVTTAFGQVVKPFECYKKVNIPLMYDASASTGVLTSIRSNNIFLVAGLAPAAADDLVSVVGSCRLRFSDFS